MRRHEQRQAGGADVGDERPHVADARRVETVGRLVEDQQLRAAEQRGGDAEALLHAERVAPERVVGAVLQPRLLERGVDA